MASAPSARALTPSDLSFCSRGSGCARRTIPGPPADPGQDRAVPSDPATLGRGPPAAASVPALQRQLDAFTEHYNEHRPHRARHRSTPGEAYRASPKAVAAGSRPHNHYRLRYDRLDTRGKMTLRRAGRVHHLGVGTPHARNRVLAFADDHQITVAELSTGEVLSIHLIEPNKTYWRNQQRAAGRAPGSETDVPRHLGPMSRDITQRRGGDSNPRWIYAHTGFRDQGDSARE